MISFDKFLSRVDETFMLNQASRSDGKIKAENQWRYGQTVMNVLWEVWPEKYQEIKDGELNCFYDNSTTRFTLEKLEREWNHGNG